MSDGSIGELPTSDGDDPRLIDARPTKEFFVSMLVRDVDLLDAIIDLIDNSVDGARRLRPPGQESWVGLKVDVETTATRFLISDNCGGISLAMAREYAFRFGRDPDRGVDAGSIGQFGVGMKRTLFKLGRHFIVESKTEDQSFSLEQDVDAWRRSPLWEFVLTDVDLTTRRSKDETGTSIEVNELHRPVADDLSNANWTNRLRSEIRLKHRLALNRGLTIQVNGQQLEPLPLELIETDDIRPGHRIERFAGGVEVDLLAGVGESEPASAGWYVFCNDRLVVGPDRTELTVWEGKGRTVRGGGVRYHDQFARFRGYARLSADESSLLPWTTTKTGVDIDHPVWRRTRQLMLELTRPVIDFLNDLDRERTYVAGDARAGQPGLSDDESIELAIVGEQLEVGTKVSFDRAVGADAFVRPSVALAKLPARQAWLRFRAATSDIQRARLAMGGNNEKDLPNAEVGRQSFEYYLRNEADE